ncbi:MAG: flagellar basal-body rod protein FlgG [Alphaproteobacteria bacterium]|nr:flagellar basal-body rod protein FlgG [Alphaproteobacteria bacterium]
MRSLFIAATGMHAQQLNVEVISNNIANVTTTGFKRQRAEFHDLLYQEFRRVGSPSTDNNTVIPAGVQVGLGVKPAAVYRIHEQGNFIKTDNDLDVAIQGRGFLNVQLPNGQTAYTRAGNFGLNAAGTIVTPDGFTVLPTITVPNNAIDITINASGQVLASIDGQVAQSNLGQFTMTTFVNQAGLQAIGDNLYLESEASGGAITGLPGQPGFGTILQGFLEASNVNVVNEITGLITAQRTFEMNSQVIQASDEMMRTVSNLR